MEEQKLIHTEVVDIDDLIQDDHNFNKGTEDGARLIERSFKDYGAGRSVLIDKNNRLVGGNKALKGFKGASFRKVVIVDSDADTLVAVRRKDVDLDSKEGRDMALLDNLTTQKNLAWDEVELQQVGANVEGFDVCDFGVSIDQLPGNPFDAEETKGEGKPTNNVTEDDFDPEEVHETKVKKGDIWILGAHRLMCADSTHHEDVMRLLAKETPDLIYTDPPYGMNAVSNSGVLKEKYKTDIHGDDDNTIAINAFKLCQAAFPNARQVWWGANYYTECLPSSECWLVWDKNNGMSDQTDCELAWANFRSVVRQFTMVSEKTNRIHPNQKPCKLFADIVDRMKKNETYTKVLDLFGGSGSTMIACEQMGIQSFIMEYDPHFCTEIIARWEKLTGRKAVRIEG